MNCLKNRSGTGQKTGLTGLKSDSGFTLIETLIALTLISLIAVSVFMVYPDVIAFSGKVKKLNRWNRELINLEKAVRQSVSEVRIPFWVDRIEVSQENGVIQIPYWNGEADSSLEMKIEDGVLKISTPGNVISFTGYEELSLLFNHEESGPEGGLTFSISKTGRESVTFKCAFGSIGKGVFKNNQ